MFSCVMFSVSQKQKEKELFWVFRKICANYLKTHFPWPMIGSLDFLHFVCLCFLDFTLLN